MKIRTYRDLRRLKTFEERYEYLRIGGSIGAATFGYDRYLNQLLYTSKRWRDIRDDIIIRDEGCDLGLEDYEIVGGIWVHHMNPITVEDLESGCEDVYDPEFLICTARLTHSAIHYGDLSMLPKPPTERRKNDTCPWR